MLFFSYENGRNMKKPYSPTADRFLVQYYRWALAEMQKEILADLSRVRRVKGTSAQKYVRFIGSLKPNAVFPAAAALVKRYHKRALELVGQTLNPEDQQWIDAFLDFEKPFTATWSPVIADQTYNALVNHVKGPRLDKRELARELRNRLKGVFASDGDNSLGPQSRRYIIKNGPLILNTHIEWGGRLPLRYSHSVTADNLQRITYDISLLSWLGVCSVTSWNLLANEDIISAAELVEELCAYFRSAFLRFDLASYPL